MKHPAFSRSCSPSSRAVGAASAGVDARAIRPRRGRGIFPRLVAVGLLTSALIASSRAAEASPAVFEPAQAPREPRRSGDVNLREAGYDVSIGVAAGIVFSGAQDLKFKRYTAGGVQTDYLFSADLDVSPDHIETLDVTAWRTKGKLDGFGVRLEAMRWSTYATAKSFEDRLGTSAPVPPFDSVEQDRFGVFATLAHRWSLSRETEARDGAYVFAGLGYGEVHTRVSHGDSNWRLGFEAYAGVAIPVLPDVRLRIEGKFIITKDVDVEGTSTEWKVDTSGKRLWGHSTFDTRFYAVTAGVEFLF